LKTEIQKRNSRKEFKKEKVVREVVDGRYHGKRA
jgi:hypothetical protein